MRQRKKNVFFSYKNLINFIIISTQLQKKKTFSLRENPKFIFTFIYLAWYNNLVSKSGVLMSIPRTHLNRIEECKQLVFLISLFLYENI